MDETLYFYRARLRGAYQQAKANNYAVVQTKDGDEAFYVLANSSSGIN